MQGGAGQLKRLILVLTLTLCGAALPAWSEPALRVASKTLWTADGIPWFGGFSAAEVSADGTDLTLLTDRGMLVLARLVRVGGTIRRVDLGDARPLRNRDGTPLRGKDRDAEGLAATPDGRMFASFENRHRVVELNTATGRTTALEPHPDFIRFGLNRGLEALSAHPDGRLFAVAETGADDTGTAPLYAFDGTGWSVTHRVPVTRPFHPVGADFDAQGRLFLLERAVSPLGFRSRIRRITLDSTPPASEVLLTTFPAAFDNLEGLSVWQDADGNTRLIAISDDNFLSLQTTQVVEFIVNR